MNISVVIPNKDQKSGDAFKVNFKSRQRHDDYINIKKLWKMLEF